jgi:hypothetical protein
MISSIITDIERFLHQIFTGNVLFHFFRAPVPYAGASGSHGQQSHNGNRISPYHHYPLFTGILTDVDAVRQVPILLTGAAPA